MIGWTSHLNPDLSYKDLEQDKRQSSDHVAEILTQKTESKAAATLRHFKMCLTEERNLYLKKEKRQACGETGVETSTLEPLGSPGSAFCWPQRCTVGVHGFPAELLPS